MIFINDDITCGSGRFCFELMEAIRLALARHFDDEKMQEFDEDLAFQKAVWLNDFSKSDFNFVVQTIEHTKMANKWQTEKQILIKHLKADPRFN